MKDIQKLKVAEILVNSGYADYMLPNNGNYIYWHAPELDGLIEAVQPFANTFEAWKQLDAIETWVLDTPKYWDLWNDIEDKIDRINSIHNHKVAIAKEFIKSIVI